MCRLSLLLCGIFYLTEDIFIQVLFHPLPPSTAACWPLRAPAGWWRHVCREREIILAEHNPKRAISMFGSSDSQVSCPSPLHHLNVEAEAFVNWIPLPSDTWAQPEHLRSAIHHAVLVTQRCVCNTHSTLGFFGEYFHKVWTFCYCSKGEVLLNRVSSSPSTKHYILFNWHQNRQQNKASA